MGKIPKEEYCKQWFGNGLTTTPKPMLRADYIRTLDLRDENRIGGRLTHIARHVNNILSDLLAAIRSSA